ncbi:THAP domain-containing protein [Phthorimaea operculella]|nr:THAP domain-containing protein [Phthorimaea operculella]
MSSEEHSEPRLQETEMLDTMDMPLKARKRKKPCQNEGKSRVKKTRPPSKTAHPTTPLLKNENDENRTNIHDVQPGTSQERKETIEIEIEECPNLETVKVKKEPDSEEYPNVNTVRVKIEPDSDEDHNQDTVTVKKEPDSAIKCEVEIEEYQPNHDSVTVKIEPYSPSHPQSSHAETSGDDSRFYLHSEVDIKFEPKDQSKLESQDDDQNGAQMGQTNSQMSRKYIRKCKYCCSVYGCLNTTEDCDFTFFGFPNDPVRRDIWIQLIDRADSKYSPRWTVCEAHFEPDQIRVEPNRKVLRKGAVPKLLLPIHIRQDKDTQTINDTTDSCVQTDNYQRDHSTQTTGQRGQSALLNAPAPPKKPEQETEIDVFQKLCDKFLTKNLSKVVKEQARLQCQYIRNRRSMYSIDYKIFCLNLFHTSSQAYDMISETLLNTPCKSTLKQMYVPIGTEVNSHVMEVLKTKTSRMSDVERHCSLVIDSMSLKPNLFYNIKEDKIYGFHEIDGIQSPEPAKYALVASIQGIFTNYKQPVGFALLSECYNYDEVSKWIDKLIEKLFEIGLKIRVLNLGPEYTNIAEEKQVTIERPYFFVKSHKIYTILEPSHLVKAVRNNLMNYDFHYGDSVAKWDHIELYEKTQHFGDMALELTDTDLTMEAVESLTNDVAEGLCRDLGEIDSTAKGTIQLLIMINNLFYILNSSELQNAFRGSELHIAFLNKMLDIFANLKLIDPNTGEDATARVKFVEGAQISLKSFLLLFENLQSEEGVSYMTRRLNQYGLEKIFGRVLKHNGSPTKPSSWHLVSAFRKLFFMCIIKQYKEGSFCDELSDVLLEGTKLFTKLASEDDDQQLENIPGENISKPTISTTDYNALDLPDENALIYICAYLLKKCFAQHKDCSLMEAYLRPPDDPLNTQNVVLREDFVRFIEAMEEKFAFYFIDKYQNNKVLRSLLQEVQGLSFAMPCGCFPMEYLKKLYLRLRIFYTLKYNNTAFKLSKKRRKYFSVTSL